jgi:hypothetical protein
MPINTEPDKRPMPRPMRLILHTCPIPDPDGTPCRHPMAARSMIALGQAYKDHLDRIHADLLETPQP